jgi:hypothetical protein
VDPKVEFLLTQKLEMWRTIGDATMLWWVSAVVLCATIIGIALTHADKIKKPRHLHVAALVVMVFFTMIFTYGLIVILYIPRLHADIVSLAAGQPGVGTAFNPELWFFRYAMYMGTGNYLLFMVVWGILWRHVSGRLKNRK